MRERFRSLWGCEKLSDECKGRIRARSLGGRAGGDEKTSLGESLRKFFNAIKAALGGMYMYLDAYNAARAPRTMCVYMYFATGLINHTAQR